MIRRTAPLDSIRFRVVTGLLLLPFVGCASDPEGVSKGEGGAPSTVVAETPASTPAPRSASPDPNDRGYAPVRLGIRPGMGGDSGFGVLVQGVSEGTSAAEGGMLAGDVIVAWGGEDLVDVMDMVERLREHRPGDVVEIVVLRDGEEIELDVTMKASQRNIEN